MKVTNIKTSVYERNDGWLADVTITTESELNWFYKLFGKDNSHSLKRQYFSEYGYEWRSIRTGCDASRWHEHLPEILRDEKERIKLNKKFHLDGGSRCDDEVFNKGTTIAVVAEIWPEVMEAWTKKVAKESGQKVDWSYAGGKAVVKALGNIEEV